MLMVAANDGPSWCYLLGCCDARGLCCRAVRLVSLRDGVALETCAWVLGCIIPTPVVSKLDSLLWLERT